MTASIIEINDVTKQYDEQYAVNQLSLSIPRGEIFGLLGPNGAGKTTTILMLLGLIEPTNGSIHVCGFDSIRNPIDVKRRVGYLPDNLGFYHHMTGFENLLYTAELNNISREIAEKRAYDLLEKVNLSESAHKKTGKYSRGMKQRLGLADVLIKNPEIIILDEPTLGIDPEGVRELLHLIKTLNKEEGITVLLSSHQLHQVQQICDRVGVFVEGKLLAEGNITELARQLFKQDTFVTVVQASPLKEELMKKIRQTDYVTNVKKNGNELEVYSKQDISSVISQLIIKSGAKLYQLTNKHFGLDEIYHRYFEGREQHGSR
ncbi:ABC transporter ATP-binding protein [Oceanobacillus halotolerans]|uniref:ABC transporter ATP-binding protein n=1 Tax=Oceanobacillus halotolerans TaxID=2663380 RepID=UPI001CF7E605|nr:ABC transporter ATP-binding protein [Oceanobacillus halotolerans]